MNTTRVVFVQCLRATWWQALGIAIAAAALARLQAPLRADPAAPLDAGSTPWLLVPLALVVFLVAAAAVECWPLFARQRPGAGWVERLQPGPWRGCAAATAGALAAATLWLTALGVLLPLALGGAPPAHAWRSWTPVAGRVLDERHAEIAFTGPSTGLRELRLRPIALLPRGTPEPTVLEVRADGALVHAAPVVIDNTWQLIRLPVTRALPAIAIRRTGGNLPLLFPDGAIEGIEATAHPAVANTLLGALALLVPLVVALAAANLAAAFVALPVNLLVVAGCLLLQLLAGLGPAVSALTAVLRGRWIPAEPLFGPTVSSLATALVAMIAAMLLRRGVRR